MEFKVSVLDWTNARAVKFCEALDDEIVEDARSSDAFPVLFVATDSRARPIGTVFLTRIGDPKLYVDHNPTMSNLYVSPSYRRHGIGEELVNEAMYYARMIGFEALNLDTPDALAYYEQRWRVKYIREAAPSLFQDPTHVIQLRT